jgi:hypothetical protein
MARRLRLPAIAMIVSAVTLLVAAGLLWLGFRSAAQVDRLVREGVLAQGTERHRSYDGRNATVDIVYAVDGREYGITVSYRTRGSPSLLDPAPVPMPQLGPEAPLQVVYLPGDPAVARLRDDLRPGMAVWLAAAGFFGFIGLVFGAVAFLIRRKPRQTAGAPARR